MAAYIPGRKKPEGSGRKKGTLNKNTIRFTEGLLERGFNILDEFVKLYGEASDEDRVTLMGKAMEFSFPKLKAVEISDSGNSKDQEIQDYIDELHKRRGKNDHSI